MERNIKKWVSSVTALYGFVFISSAFAQTPTLTNPLGQNATFQTVLNGFNTFLLAIAAPICGIMVVWGGFQMITARGNPEKFSEGKKTLLYAAVGFVVVILASSVAPLIQSIFNGS
jgi:hypothetical protein